ncbi:hypothetical protein PoB_005972700 [Plakobranchus ocellatus]|uniref:Uncharacterized protein n=1 Tax=Plakobranchus ocellatus TaxID=259542 RepID=A0AAV4CMJ8_9GAST|nr:hypothetical protein PoB_005972700 [Plakobranchus ocellatus]
MMGEKSIRSDIQLKNRQDSVTQRHICWMQRKGHGIKQVEHSISRDLVLTSKWRQTKPAACSRPGLTLSVSQAGKKDYPYAQTSLTAPSGHGSKRSPEITPRNHAVSVFYRNHVVSECTLEIMMSLTVHLKSCCFRVFTRNITLYQSVH